jgi:uncharacterized delta-60 repeat protein
MLLSGCGGGGGGSSTGSSSSSGSGTSGNLVGVISPISNVTNTNAFSSNLQSDGKLVLAGRSGPSCAIARLNSTKALDTTFNSTGVLLTTPGTYACEIWSIATQSDGKLLAFLSRDSGNYIYRFNLDGSFDQSFAEKGIYRIPSGGAGMGSSNSAKIFVDPDGKINLVGIIGQSFVIHRLTVNGLPDTSFGSAGSVSVRTPSPGVAPEWRYRISRTVSGDYVSSIADSFYVFKVSSNGVLDTGYGNFTPPYGGLPATYSATFPGLPTVGGSRVSSLSDVALLPDGSFYAVGISSFDTVPKVFEIAVSKGTPSGKLDVTFNKSGMLLTGIKSGGGLARAQSNGKLLVATGPEIYRFNQDGTLDTTFMNGVVAAAASKGGVAGIHVQSDDRIIVVFQDFSFIRLAANGIGE